MKTRDQILLENMYLKTKTSLTEEVQNDNIFTSLVNLNLYDIYPPATDSVYYEIPQKVKVRYRLNVQYVTAGIGSITAQLVDIDPITVERITYTENEDEVEEVEEITLDLSNASFTGSVASDEHGQIIASAIEIHLNEDNSAERVELVF